MVTEKEKKPCFRCVTPTNFHVYRSERGDEKIYHCCEECETELQK